jgi:N-acyl-D-amino-acid deacylase
MGIKLKGGLVYDGSGKSPEYGDLVIEGNTIAAMGKLPDSPGDRIYDCGGLLITPGFVDTHRHCDAAVVRDSDFGTIEISQGITSILCGNCGLTPFPAKGEDPERYFRFLEPCLGPIPPSFASLSLGAYLEKISRAGLPLNLGTLVGTGAVKYAVKGFDPGPYSSGEMDRAQGLLREALENGAVGISAGIMYPPECYSREDEFVRLLRAAAPYGRTVACHIRGEGDELVASVREIIGICRDAGLPLNISHFKSTGMRNWRREIHKAIALIEAARQEGQEVTVDFYPYTGGATMLLSLIPPRLLTDDKGNRTDWFGTAGGKEELRAELARKDPAWESMVDLIGWDRIIIGSVKSEANKRYQGKSIGENTRRFGFEDEVDFTGTLLAEEAGQAGVILMSMDQEDVDAIARLPYAAVISDSLYGGGEHPHPRLYGSFIRILKDYVLDRGILPFEEAIRKMTSLPAERYRLLRRGLLKPGNFADITVLRQEKLRDNATFAEPRQLSSGVEYVFVNGSQTLPEIPLRVSKGNILYHGL